MPHKCPVCNDMETYDTQMCLRCYYEFYLKTESLARKAVEKVTSSKSPKSHTAPEMPGKDH